jgi:hypothetical protein
MMLIDMLVRTPDMREMTAKDAGIAASLRLWVVMNKLGRRPMQAVAERLNCARAAAHLHLLLEEVGSAWPEPFRVAPPCCPRLSHDEALIVDMVRLGGRGDRPGFDRLLAEMIPADMRDRLYLSASVLSRVLEG